MKIPVRTGSILVMATLLVGAIATPALAWANGAGGPNTYGTHDGILLIRFRSVLLRRLRPLRLRAMTLGPRTACV